MEFSPAGPELRYRTAVQTLCRSSRLIKFSDLVPDGHGSVPESKEDPRLPGVEAPHAMRPVPREILPTGSPTPQAKRDALGSKE